VGPNSIHHPIICSLAWDLQQLVDLTHSPFASKLVLSSLKMGVREVPYASALMSSVWPSSVCRAAPVATSQRVHQKRCMNVEDRRVTVIERMHGDSNLERHKSYFWKIISSRRTWFSESPSGSRKAKNRTYEGKLEIKFLIRQMSQAVFSSCLLLPLCLGDTSLRPP
jgi:hypothetical protein